MPAWPPNGLYRAVARGLTFTWFAFTLLWFWSSWRQVAALASAMGVAGGLLATAGTIAAASLILAVPDILGRKGEVSGRRVAVPLRTLCVRLGDDAGDRDSRAWSCTCPRTENRLQAVSKYRTSQQNFD